MPPVLPIAAAALDIEVSRGDETSITCIVTKDGDPYDFDGVAVIAEIIMNTGVTLPMDVDASTGSVRLVVQEATSESLAQGWYRWRLIVDRGDAPQAWLAGWLKVRARGVPGGSPASPIVRLVEGDITIVVQESGGERRPPWTVDDTPPSDPAMGDGWFRPSIRSAAVWTGSDWEPIADSESYGPGRSVVSIPDGGTGASDVATARTNLGLGTIATQSAANVTISGGSIAGISDIAVLDGGTGASTAKAARENLDVQRRQWVNVKDFDATGAGVVDDTAAIQAATNSLGSAGGVVYFPRGIYLVSSLLLRSNVDFISDHATLRGTNSVLHGIFRNPLADSAINFIGNILIEGFTFDGGGLARAAVYLYKATGVTVRRNLVQNMNSNGIHVGQFCTDCLIEDNRLLMRVDEPIGSVYLSVGIQCNSTLQGGVSGGADTDPAIELDGPPIDLNERNVIRNNRIEYGTHAVALSGTRRVSIEGNHIYRQSHRGIILTASTDNTIKGNWCIDAQSTAGVHLCYQSNRNSIRENVVITSRSAIEGSGINIYYGCSDNEVTDNTVVGAAVAGVRVAVGSQRNRIMRNRVSDCAVGVRLVNLLPSATAGASPDYPNAGYTIPQLCPDLADNQVVDNLLQRCSTGIHVDQRQDPELLAGVVPIPRTRIAGNRVIDATTGIRVGIADPGGVSDGSRSDNEFVRCATNWSAMARTAFRGIAARGEIFALGGPMTAGRTSPRRYNDSSERLTLDNFRAVTDAPLSSNASVTIEVDGATAVTLTIPNGASTSALSTSAIEVPAGSHIAIKVASAGGADATATLAVTCRSEPW